MSVWILVFYIAAYNAGGPAVIDNIATVQECERVRQILNERAVYARCIEVRKTK